MVFNRILALCLLVLMLQGCQSIERYSERERRLRHYRRLAAALPADATKEQVERVFPGREGVPRPKPLISWASGIPTELHLYPIDEENYASVVYTWKPGLKDSRWGYRLADKVIVKRL
jgi:hypothetical protein